MNIEKLFPCGNSQYFVESYTKEKPYEVAERLIRDFLRGSVNRIVWAHYWHRRFGFFFRSVKHRSFVLDDYLGSLGSNTDCIYLQLCSWSIVEIGIESKNGITEIGRYALFGGRKASNHPYR